EHAQSHGGSESPVGDDRAMEAEPFSPWIDRCQHKKKKKPGKVLRQSPRELQCRIEDMVDFVFLLPHGSVPSFLCKAIAAAQLGTRI
ncbi:MAG: hypothetical protein IJG56_00060, partial [Clostridia bacterium]|nr:hypothetical protein [Clostridia bacterium]